MAMNVDESWLAVAENSGVLAVFPVDPSTGTVGQAVASVPDSHATGVAFSPSGGQIVASSSDDDVVRVYNFDPASSTLATPAAREFPIYRDPSRIAVADLNEDGIVSTIQQLPWSTSLMRTPSPREVRCGSFRCCARMH